MAITEESVVDQITVLEDGQIQVRRSDRVLRDGVVIASVPHRHVVVPGADLTSEDARVKKIGEVEHTSAVITAYEESLLS